MITYTGRITYIRFYSEETKFIVATFDCDQEETTITITGNMAHVSKDEHYKITGDYKMHRRYGKQFVITSYETVMPSERQEIIRYLSSPLFKGIGNKQAEVIVDTLGDDALSKIREDPSCLSLVRGMSERKVKIITDVLNDQDADTKLLSFFMAHGISTRLLGAILDMYGDHAVDVITHNPYQLVDDIEGVGFKSADALAQKIHFDRHSHYRVRSCISDALTNLCFRSGATYSDYDHLKKAAMGLLDDLSSDDFDEALATLVEENKIVLEEDRYYPFDLYDSEVTIASLFKRFSRLPKIPYQQKVLDAKIAEVEKELGITYDDTQKQAICQFISEPAMILTGGPGTGKTTIVQAILKIYHSLYPDEIIDLVAPTGRAAKRLSELTGIEANTIHRLLKWDLHKNTFAVNENNPLSTQMLVIDEFSMVDSLLFARLLKAGTHLKKILMIGDEQQLPPVACGNVLRDLMNTNIVPTVILTNIYRQASGSGIVKLAHAIRNNQFDPALLNSSDVHFIHCVNYEVPKTICELVSTLLDDGYTIDDIQVLAPMYKGVAGIDALNEAVQNLVNPENPFTDELKAGRRTFRVNDKILQLKNRVDDEVFNGDIGRLTDILPKDPIHNLGEELEVTYDPEHVIDYPSTEFNQITHAYCMSVHKSQGNEFPVVIMSVLSDYSIMMRKNLLYTGLTRAKSQLYLVGDENVFRAGIQRQTDVNRATTLTNRLLENSRRRKINIKDFMEEEQF